MFEGINNKKLKILDELGVNNLIETKVAVSPRFLALGQSSGWVSWVSCYLPCRMKRLGKL